jgi:hypothetical protein
MLTTYRSQAGSFCTTLSIKALRSIYEERKGFGSIFDRFALKKSLGVLFMRLLGSLGLQLEGAAFRLSAFVMRPRRNTTAQDRSAGEPKRTAAARYDRAPHSPACQTKASANGSNEAKRREAAQNPPNTFHFVYIASSVGFDRVRWRCGTTQIQVALKECPEQRLTTCHEITRERSVRYI